MERKDFNQRSYRMPSEHFTGKTEVIIRTGNKVVSRMEVQNPGMVTVLSHPEEDGIEIVTVSPGGRRQVDLQTPEGESFDDRLQDWQAQALGL